MTLRAPVPTALTSVVPPGPWIKEFLPLTRAGGVPAEVREEPRKVLLVVRVPLTASKEETYQRLDAALDLVDKAKLAATDRTSASDTAERHIHDWWSRQRADAAIARRPDSTLWAPAVGHHFRRRAEPAQPAWG